MAAKDNISLVPKPVKNDIILVPQGSEDSVYDVSSEPLVNFHHYERLQQELQNEVGIFIFRIKHITHIYMCILVGEFFVVYLIFSLPLGYMLSYQI